MYRRTPQCKLPNLRDSPDDLWLQLCTVRISVGSVSVVCFCPQNPIPSVFVAPKNRHSQHTSTTTLLTIVVDSFQQRRFRRIWAMRFSSLRRTKTSKLIHPVHTAVAMISSPRERRTRSYGRDESSCIGYSPPTLQLRAGSNHTFSPESSATNTHLRLQSSGENRCNVSSALS